MYKHNSAIFLGKINAKFVRSAETNIGSSYKLCDITHAYTAHNIYIVKKKKEKEKKKKKRNNLYRNKWHIKKRTEGERERVTYLGVTEPGFEF